MLEYLNRTKQRHLFYFWSIWFWSCSSEGLRLYWKWRARNGRETIFWFIGWKWRIHFSLWRRWREQDTNWGPTLEVRLRCSFLFLCISQSTHLLAFCKFLKHKEHYNAHFLSPSVTIRFSGLLYNSNNLEFVKFW